jgi:hypothetical protein
MVGSRVVVGVIQRSASRDTARVLKLSPDRLLIIALHALRANNDEIYIPGSLRPQARKGEVQPAVYSRANAIQFCRIQPVLAEPGAAPRVGAWIDPWSWDGICPRALCDRAFGLGRPRRMARLVAGPQD